MRTKLHIYKYDKNHLWIKIDSGLLEYWQKEAQGVFPNQTTTQKHYVQMAMLCKLLYDGNHSLTYHNTYIVSELFKSITNNYYDILQKHRSIIRTNNQGKSKFKSRFICAYRIEVPNLKQGKMLPYQIKGCNKSKDNKLNRVQELFNAICSSIYENLENNKGAMLCTSLEDVFRRMFIVDNRSYNKLFKQVRSYKTKEKNKYQKELKQLTKPIKFDPKATFEERYSYLYLSKDILNGDIARKYWTVILKYLDRQPAKHNEDEKYMEDGNNLNRYYHTFHQTPKTLREKYLMFNGDNLDEAFDVHQCFYVLMCKLLETNNDIPKEELLGYEKLVRCGDLYETIVNYVKETPYANDKLYSTDARNYIKGEIQRWRNMLPKRVECQKGVVKGIDEFYEKFFPSIRQFILNYKTRKQKKKKNNCKVKQLQCDCIKIETNTMNKVCRRLEEYGIYALTIHDSVYIRVCDKTMLESKGIIVENVFWEELGLLIDTPNTFTPEYLPKE